MAPACTCPFLPAPVLACSRLLPLRLSVPACPRLLPLRLSVPTFCLLPVSDCTCACPCLLTPAPLPACSCLLPLRLSVPAFCLLPVSDYICACPCLLTPALPIVLPPPAPTCRLSAAPSRAHQAPFYARELLKTGAVSENAPGAHRDVPRDGECSTDGRRTRTVISSSESPSFREADTPF